jgi:predicted CoA-binding protein
MEMKRDRMKMKKDYLSSVLYALFDPPSAMRAIQGFRHYQSLSEIEIPAITQVIDVFTKGMKLTRVAFATDSQLQRKEDSGVAIHSLPWAPRRLWQ